MVMWWVVVFYLKQKTEEGMVRCRVGSERGIRDRDGGGGAGRKDH